MTRNSKWILTLLLLAATLAAGCDVMEEPCDDFNSTQRMMENTNAGIPRGFYRFLVQGSVLQNYPPDLLLTLNHFVYWRDLYWYYCRDDDRYYRDDYYHYRNSGPNLRLYHENALYYAGILRGYYRRAFNCYLDFDGVSSFVITGEPVDPDSTVTPFTLFSISDLGVVDIGVDITLDQTVPARMFRLIYRSGTFSSLEAGSSVTFRIYNIRPPGEAVRVDITQPGILFNEAGNLESVSVEGDINALRR